MNTRSVVVVLILVIIIMQLVITHRQAAGQLDMMDLEDEEVQVYENYNHTDDIMGGNYNNTDGYYIDLNTDPAEEKARQILAQQMQLQNSVDGYSLEEFVHDKEDLQRQLEQRQPRHGRLRPGIHEGDFWGNWDHKKTSESEGMPNIQATNLESHEQTMRKLVMNDGITCMPGTATDRSKATRKEGRAYHNLLQKLQGKAFKKPIPPHYDFDDFIPSQTNKRTYESR
tara:strand:+ start:2135 stop:2815 length:681 start_codon:yes stop_codon:yes gene_type:complete